MTEPVFDRMLPIPEPISPVYEYYRLAFDADGCSMWHNPDGSLVFYPLMPV